MLTKKQLFTRGMLDISPHMLSVIPFGIICGSGITLWIVWQLTTIIGILLGSMYRKSLD